MEIKTDAVITVGAMFLMSITTLLLLRECWLWIAWIYANWPSSSKRTVPLRQGHLDDADIDDEYEEDNIEEIRSPRTRPSMRGRSRKRR